MIRCLLTPSILKIERDSGWWDDPLWRATMCYSGLEAVEYASNPGKAIRKVNKKMEKLVELRNALKSSGLCEELNGGS